MPEPAVERRVVVQHPQAALILVLQEELGVLVLAKSREANAVQGPEHGTSEPTHPGRLAVVDERRPVKQVDVDLPAEDRHFLRHEVGLAPLPCDPVRRGMIVVVPLHHVG